MHHDDEDFHSELTGFLIMGICFSKERHQRPVAQSYHAVLKPTGPSLLLKEIQANHQNDSTIKLKMRIVLYFWLRRRDHDVPPNSEMVEAATGPYSGDIAGDGSYGISPVVVGDAGSFGTGVFSVR